jgi:predicted transcriptional regulator
MVSTIIIAVHPHEPDRLYAGTIRAMRQSLNVTEDQLARASGMACRCIKDIEAGGATTHAERLVVEQTRCQRLHAVAAKMRSRASEVGRMPAVSAGSSRRSDPSQAM